MIRKINLKDIRYKLFFLFSSIAVLAAVTTFAAKYTDYPSDIYDIKLIDTKPQEIKITPKDRGGLQFQNQDKNVFDILEK